MTRCHRFQEVLAYEQGFLDDDEGAETEVHIRCCRACQRALARMDWYLPELYPAMWLSTMDRRPSRDVYMVIMKSLQ